jgi:hypothetical protein
MQEILVDRYQLVAEHGVEMFDDLRVAFHWGLLAIFLFGRGITARAEFVFDSITEKTEKVEYRQ